jgi:predicted TIM-barrel fold metal-dependent hydrolase
MSGGLDCGASAAHASLQYAAATTSGVLQVVDPHIHLWNLEALHYPWLRETATTFMGDYQTLVKSYDIERFQEDAAGIEVLKVVHIEAGHDANDPVAETRWLQSLADNHAGVGLPHAIVAYADLSAPDVERTLDAHLAFANVRGIRQILNVHTDRYYDYVGRHFMREPGWQAGFAHLAARGLSFDLQIYPSQMPEAVRLAQMHPDTTLIINHTGMFVDRASVTGWRQWRDGMRGLAACPNVNVKISGMGMFDHSWTVESLRPYVLETIDTFGIERCMFASNFPVDRLYSSYPQVWRAYAAIVAGASPVEQEALFKSNAARIYRI